MYYVHPHAYKLKANAIKTMCTYARKRKNARFLSATHYECLRTTGNSNKEHKQQIQI